MKPALAGIAAIVTGILPALVGCAEKITDERDGQKYAVIKIADRLWFAENLNFETGNSSCPEGDNRNCSKYGRLYTRDDALRACPSGCWSQGKFDGIGGYAYFWSSTDSEDGLAYYLFLDFSSKEAVLNAFDKGSARSVRCVK